MQQKFLLDLEIQEISCPGGRGGRGLPGMQSCQEALTARHILLFIILNREQLYKVLSLFISLPSTSQHAITWIYKLNMFLVSIHHLLSYSLVP